MHDDEWTDHWVKEMWESGKIFRKVSDFGKSKYGPYNWVSKEIDTMPKAKFELDERVKLKTGTAPCRVIKVSPGAGGKWEYYLEYESKVNKVWKREDQIEAYEGEGENVMTTEKKLYEIKTPSALFEVNTVAYGHKLAVNSKGEWVMEIKGTGEIVAVDKKNVEEVLPFTINVQYQDNSKEYAYLAEAGEFTVGFYLVPGRYGGSWQIARVTKVDTKSRHATVKFQPLGKLSVETLNQD